MASLISCAWPSPQSVIKVLSLSLSCHSVPLLIKVIHFCCCCCYYYYCRSIIRITSQWMAVNSDPIWDHLQTLFFHRVRTKSSILQVTSDEMTSTMPFIHSFIHSYIHSFRWRHYGPINFDSHKGLPSFTWCMLFDVSQRKPLINVIAI